MGRHCVKGVRPEFMVSEDDSEHIKLDSALHVDVLRVSGAQGFGG
jgi:hypothetical protein